MTTTISLLKKERDRAQSELKIQVKKNADLQNRIDAIAAAINGAPAGY